MPTLIEAYDFGLMKLFPKFKMVKMKDVHIFNPDIDNLGI